LRGALAISPLPDRERALGLVRRLKVMADPWLDADERESALQAMSRDKKARAGKVRFVLLDAIGSPRLVNVGVRVRFAGRASP